jgi:ABC-type antimicrobial peptide transport system permease subunit
MFFPLAQNPDSDTSLVVRSQLPPGESVPFTFETWSDALACALFPARVATAILGVMGFLAPMLAVTGVFGIAMYSVSKRMKEFGIRVALGAQPVQVMGSALGRPLILLRSGSATGLLLGAIASQLLAQIVYQATPRDPLVLAAVLATMTTLGLFALRVHPAGLLRED